MALSSLFIVVYNYTVLLCSFMYLQQKQQLLVVVCAGFVVSMYWGRQPFENHFVILYNN